MISVRRVLAGIQAVADNNDKGCPSVVLRFHHACGTSHRPTPNLIGCPAEHV